MIEHPSLTFAKATVAVIERMSDEFGLAKADLLVETFRNGKVSGLSVSNAMTTNRVNLLLEPSTNLPRVIYGNADDFDYVTGRARNSAHASDYRYGTSESIAHLAMEWLVNNRPVWMAGKDEEESE